MADGLQMVPAPLDTARFGYRIGRVRLPRGVDAPEDLLDRFRASDLDIAVLRFDAGDIRVTWQLEQTSGDDVTVLHADTLMHVGGEAVPVLGDLPDGYHYAHAHDPDQLAAAVRDSMAGYANHYAANPLTPDTGVVDAYLEWTRTHVESDHCDVVAIMHEGGDIAAFLASSTTDDETAINIGGVSVDHRRRNLYVHGLDELCRRSIERGVNRAVTSTQAANIGVQRAWADRGWKLFRAENTVHLIRRELLEQEGLLG